MVAMMIYIMAMFAMASAAPADLAHSTCTSGECPGALMLNQGSSAVQSILIDDTVSLLQATLHVHLNSADLPVADFDDSEEDDSELLEEATTVTEKRISDVIATSQEADDCKARLNRFDSLGEQKLDKAGNDPLFPPVGASIAPAGSSCGDSAAGISESCDKYNHWKTFQDVASKSASNPFKVFGPSGIEFSDIGQGELGNCYFLAALAAIATHHAPIISDMFVERDSWKDNVFKTKWLVNGKESVISVDNMIPANDDGTFFSQPSATGEWWVVILAKTWAKIYGSFKVIEGGIAGNVIAAITRAPSVFLDHEKLEPAALWKSLTDAFTAKFPMTAGTSNNAKYGLAAGHAYAILGAFHHARYGHVVKMFNPWRSDHYKGEIPNTVEVNGPQSGVFTIKLTEFKDAFDSSEIAQVHKGYVATAKTIATGQGTALSVRVDKPGQFFVSLTWPGSRMMEPCKLSQPQGEGLVVADEVSKVHKSKLLTDTIANYNSVNAQVENVQGGKYEVFATVKFPSRTQDGYPAVAVDKVQFTVYAPSNAEINEASVSDVSLELFGPLKDNKPCELAHVPGAGNFKRDDNQLSALGVPTYWSLGKNEVLYFPKTDGDEWFVVDKASWSKDKEEAGYRSKVKKQDIVCACEDSASGVGGFGGLLCSQVSNSNAKYGNIKCHDSEHSATVQTYCPKTCGVCPSIAAQPAAKADPAAKAAQAAEEAKKKADAEAAAPKKAADEAASKKSLAEEAETKAEAEAAAVAAKDDKEKEAAAKKLKDAKAAEKKAADEATAKEAAAKKAAEEAAAEKAAAEQKAAEEKAKRPCHKKTGGTCRVLSCSKSRGPTDCVGGWLSKECECQTGYCSDSASDGKCHPK